MAANSLALGSVKDHDRSNDWAVIKLKEPIVNAKPLKLSRTPVALHGCKVEEEYKCQKLIGISAHDHKLPAIGEPPWGKTVISSFDLYSYMPATSRKSTPSELGGDRSAFKGASGGMNFLANSDGTFVRVNGELVPVGIQAGQPFNGENMVGANYNGGKGIGAYIVGLDGNFGSAIQRLAGE